MRAVPVALRTVAEAMGGMTALAARTGLNRETLYRTLSEKGNPRLDTLTAILSPSLADSAIILARQPLPRCARDPRLQAQLHPTVRFTHATPAPARRARPPCP